jgi:hypothetical protein
MGHSLKRKDGGRDKFFLGGSLAPLGVTVSFVSAAPADKLDRLLNCVNDSDSRSNSREGSSLQPLTPLIHRR